MVTKSSVTASLETQSECVICWFSTNRSKKMPENCKVSVWKGYKIVKLLVGLQLVRINGKRPVLWLLDPLANGRCINWAHQLFVCNWCEGHTISPRILIDSSCWQGQGQELFRNRRAKSLTWPVELPREILIFSYTRVSADYTGYATLFCSLNYVRHHAHGTPAVSWCNSNSAADEPVTTNHLMLQFFVVGIVTCGF